MSRGCIWGSLEIFFLSLQFFFSSFRHDCLLQNPHVCLSSHLIVIFCFKKTLIYHGKVILLLTPNTLFLLYLSLLPLLFVPLICLIHCLSVDSLTVWPRSKLFQGIPFILFFFEFSNHFPLCKLVLCLHGTYIICGMDIYVPYPTLRQRAGSK